MEEGLFCDKKRSNIKKLNHVININGYVFERKTSFSFVNESETEHKEMIYRFSKVRPPHSFVAELKDLKTLEVEKMVGKIKEKAEAQELYDDSISSGNKAALLEEDDNSEFFVISLGNVKPQTEVTIITEYTDLMESDLSNDKGEEEGNLEYRYFIPALYYDSTNDGENEKKMNVEMIIDQPDGKILNISTPSHPNCLISTDNESESTSKCWKTKESIEINKDFMIRIIQMDSPICSLRIAPIRQSPFGSYTHCGLLNVTPHFPLSKNNNNKYELILLVDCSGSMSGSRIKAARKAMLLFLQSLDIDEYDIQMNVIRFGSIYKSLWDESKSLKSDRYYQEVKDFCGNMKSNLGGTVLAEPMKFILSSMKKKEDYCRQLFLFTDGECDSPQRVIRQIEQNSSKEERRSDGKTRIFSFGIGRNISFYFLKKCSELSNGSCVFIENAKIDMKRMVILQLSNAFRTSIHSFDIKGFPLNDSNISYRIKTSSSSSEETTTTTRDKVLFNGRSHFEYYFFTKNPLIEEEEEDKEDKELSICFKYQKKEQKERILMIEEKESCLDVLVAQEYLQQKQLKKEEIISLGTHFQLLTPHTSFFIEKENEESIVEMKKEIVGNHSHHHQQQHRSQRRNNTDLSLINARVQEIKGIMESNIDNILNRRDVLSELNEQCDVLEANSFEFKKKSSSVSGMMGNMMSGVSSFFSGFFTGEKKGKSNHKMTSSSFDIPYGSSSTSRSTLSMDEDKRKIDDNHLRCLDEQILSKNDNFEEIKKDKEPLLESKEEEKEEKRGIRDYVNIKNLEDVLMNCDRKGIWTLSDFICDKIGISTSSILQQKDSSICENLWISAIIVCVLETFYAPKRSEWELIVQKSKKNIIKEIGGKQEADELFTKAQDFVNKQ